MYIQCSTARLVIGLPATTAASVAGTEPAPLEEDDFDDEPQPATISAATTKKAHSAGMDLKDFIKTLAMVAADSGDASRNGECLIDLLVRRGGLGHDRLGLGFTDHGQQHVGRADDRREPLDRVFRDPHRQLRLA